jgi:hypothetical protein
LFNVGNFNANDFDDVHDLKDIDLAVVKGNFAVAENGAIWMKMKKIDIELYILLHKILLL